MSIIQQAGKEGKLVSAAEGARFRSNDFYKGYLASAEKIDATRAENMNIYGRAAAATGILTESIQDSIANMAVGTKDQYKEYLATKQATLDHVRAETLRAFMNNYAQLIELGFSESEAERKAQEIAKDVKAAQMKLYHILYPHSGKEVKRVY
jgi:hypothetical protein